MIFSQSNDILSVSDHVSGNIKLVQVCRGGGKWAAKKRARAVEHKNRKEEEAEKDRAAIRQDGRQETGKERRDRLARERRFAKDQEISDLQAKVKELEETIKELQKK